MKSLQIAVPANLDKFFCRKKFLIVAIFFFNIFNIPQVISQQPNDDSLLAVIESASGKERAELLLLLSRRNLSDNPEKSLLYARQAETIARSKKSKILISNALKIQGDALFALDSLNASAIAYSLAAETEELLSPQRPDSLMRRLSDAGYAFQEMGLFDKALDYFQHALPISRGQNDSVEIASNLSNIGVSLKMLGRYGEAIGAFNQALELDAALVSESDMALDYNNIGMVYQAWHQYDRAIEFFTKALEIDERLGNRHKLSTRWSNIGQVYLAWGKIPEAIDYFNKALAIDREMNATSKIAIRLQGIGLTYLSLKEYQKAIDYFKESYQTFNSLGLKFQSAIILAHIGDASLAMSDEKEAESFYQQSLKLSQSIDLKPTIIAAAKGLYGLYKNQGNYRKSLEYFEIFKIAEDSVFSEASARQINEFKIRYETEKKERENQLLTKDIQIKIRNQWFLMTVVIALIFLSIALIYAFRLKKRSFIQSRALYEKESELSKLKIDQVEQQNHHLQEVLFAEEEIRRLQIQSLEQKNHELTSATMLIANKNEIFEKLKKLASEIEDKPLNGNREIVKSIFREIERQTDIESQWDQFKIHFESVHKSFFTKLHKNNPALTQTDLQLCAYIKLNMATKEISKLMNITPESVNTHRYRLRKKIKLQAEETLDDFLHSL